MPAHVTQHAHQRGRERLGLGRAALERTAEIALGEGFKHSDARGKLKRWIDRIYFAQRSANNVRIHGEQLFLFAGSTLVTVFPVPAEFHRVLKKMREQRAQEAQS